MRHSPRAIGILVAGLALVGGAARAEETLDFEALAAGSVAAEVFSRSGLGPVGVRGVNSRLGDRNAALIFDSSRPTGGDLDLGTPNERCPSGGPGRGASGGLGSQHANCRALSHVLIVAESLTDSDGDGLVDDPDDEQVQRSDGVARLELDFARFGSVSLIELTVLDFERAARARLFDPAGKLIRSVPIQPTGDNGVARRSFGASSGVARLEIELRGSGAIDNVIFEPGPVAVPDVVGLPLDRAAATLEERWLELAPPPLAPPYPIRVASQLPVAGSRVPIRSAVTVEVAVEVPDLRDLELAAARGRLAERGLAAAFDAVDPDIDWLAYRVAAQEPESGSFLPTGSKVALELATAVRVPKVTDLALAEARARLAERRLAAALDREPEGADWARHHVEAQRPGPAEWVPADSEIALTLGLTVRVPDCADLSLSEARRRLEERGLGADVGAQELLGGPEFTYRVGPQSPASGTWVAAGTPVLLTVAGSVIVPDVRGLGWSAAGQELGRRRLELVAAPPGFEPRPEVSATVRAQRPEPEALAPIDSAVRVDLDLEVTVPEVRGRRPDAARSRLVGLGLEASGAAELPPAGVGGVWIVDDQDPKPGARVASGTAVSLSLGEVVVVPEVRGLPLPDAEASLSGRRLVGAVEGAEPGAAAPSTLVERQSLEPGTYARIGASVVLGMAADEVEVPRLRGLTTGRARERLEASGLRLDANLLYATGSPVGVVLAQRPAAGARVERDRAVAVTLGEPLPPPDPWRIPWWWLLLLLLLLLALGQQRLRRPGKPSADFRLEADADLAGLHRGIRVSAGGDEPIGLDVRLRGHVDPGVQTIQIDDPSER